MRLIIPILFILAFLIIPSVSAVNVTKSFPAADIVVANQTTTLNTSGATPFIIWAAAIYLGILLILISFFKFPNGEEGLVSIMAWLPFAYAAYTSFSVDIVNSAGVAGGAGSWAMMENHTIYSFNTISIVLLVALAFAIGNTYRIWVSQKKLQELSGGGEAADPDYI